MANKTVYPYGTGGQLPSSIGIINDCTTGGADKALSAEMGVELNVKKLTIDPSYNKNLVISGDYFSNYYYSNVRYWCAFVLPCEVGTEITFGFNSSTYDFGIFSYDSKAKALDASNNTPIESTGWVSGQASLTVSNSAGKWIAICVKLHSGNTFSNTQKTEMATFTAQLSINGTLVKGGVFAQIDSNSVTYKGEGLDSVLTNIEHIATGKASLADMDVRIISGTGASNFRIRAASYFPNRPRIIHFDVGTMSTEDYSIAVQTNYTKADVYDPTVNYVDGGGWMENDVLASTPNAEWLGVNFKKNDGSAFTDTDLATLLASDIVITLIEPSSGIGTDIVTLNNEATTLQYLRNLITPNYAPLTYTAGRKPFTLLHFSDLHADAENLERILQYRDKYTSFIDDVIGTGDLIKNKFTEDFTFWSAKGADDILISTGNHEYYNGESSQYYQSITPKQVYDKFFAPYLSNWGSVVFPSNASTNGYNYYYKDYTSLNVRLIVLDNLANMKGERDNVQATWLASVLESARVAGLHVICALHIGSTLETVFDNPFTSYKNVINGDGEGSEGANAGTYAEFYTLRDAVETFIGNGGKFIAWIGGHRHVDCIGMLTNYNQCQINVATASSGHGWYIVPLGDDCDRTDGTRQQDCFNIYSVDTEKMLLRVFRVGSNVDRDGRDKNALLYDYANKVVKFVD